MGTHGAAPDISQGRVDFVHHWQTGKRRRPMNSMSITSSVPTSASAFAPWDLFAALPVLFLSREPCRSKYARRDDSIELKMAILSSIQDPQKRSEILSKQGKKMWSAGLLCDLCAKLTEMRLNAWRLIPLP